MRAKIITENSMVSTCKTSGLLNKALRYIQTTIILENGWPQRGGLLNKDHGLKNYMLESEEDMAKSVCRIVKETLHMNKLGTVGHKYRQCQLAAFVYKSALF